MKTTSTLFLALALGLFTASNASAGLITDPLGFQAPILDQGLTTDPLGHGGPKHVTLPPVNVAAASQFLASVIADGKTVRLSDLFLSPEFFAAAHASGPEADALRGQIDWLMLSGVILGLDGDDGLDDLTGDAGDDFSDGTTQVLGFSDGTTQVHQRPTAPTTPGIILGGPGTDTIILGGPGTDTARPQAQLTPLNPSIILGGPGTDTIILGGPGTDTVQAPVNGFVFGTTSYLK